MAGGYAIDVERALVLTRGWDVLTDDDVHIHASTLARDPRFHPRFAQLADLRDVTRIDVTPAGVRKLAALNPFGDGSQRAIVASMDVVFGISRMYESLSEKPDQKVRVFRDLDLALDWLAATDASARTKSSILEAIATIRPL
jgi:hypothetical protein